MFLLDPFLPASRSVIQKRIAWTLAILLGCLVLWFCSFGIVFVLERYDHKLNESKWFREPSSQSSGLVVVVHGWTKGPQDMLEVANVTAGVESLGQPGIYLWGYDSDRFSNADPRGLADALARKIRELHQHAKGDVILIGHSLGGLLLRRAFLTGLAGNEEWSHAVSRIVLLAAPNRGTEAISRSRFLWVADAIAASFGVGQLIRSTYRGAPFVVDLRIDWIRRFLRLDQPPLVVQIVGRKDQVVSSDDSIDLMQFPNSIDLRLPNSTHESVIYAKESGELIQQALTAKPDISKRPDAPRTLKLLLVHGIRDYGERFTAIGDAVTNYAKLRGVQLEASAPRYSYFSALEFVNPFSRRLKIYEFADMYTEMLAKPPIDAPIFFVGHSFGTFLMGEGMKIYNSMSFERTYLAGSVLDQAFFADNRFLGNRIKYLRNDIATSDWPVGILCSAIHGLGLADDVGTGGFDGFTRKGEGAKYDGMAVKDMLRRANEIVGDRGYLWGLASRAAPGILLFLAVLTFYLVFIGRRPIVSLAGIVAVMWVLNII